MSEMVERVAKAIRQNVAEIEQRHDVHDADPMWFAEEYARAALAAMREPTKEMIRAANLCHWPDGVASAWRAMIDEALK